jgi:glutamine synthetase type III
LIKLYDDIKNTVLIWIIFLLPDHSDVTATANEFSFKGAEILTKLREKVDTIEDFVADEFWPIASYQKLISKQKS